MLRAQDVEAGEIDKGLAAPTVDTEQVKAKAQDTKEEAKQNVSGLLANVKQALGFGGNDGDNQTATDRKITGAHESSATKTVESHQAQTGKSQEGKGEVCFEVRAHPWVVDFYSFIVATGSPCFHCVR